MSKVTQDRDLSQLSAGPEPSCPCLGSWGEGSKGRACQGVAGRGGGPGSEPASRSTQRKGSLCQFPLWWQSQCSVESVGWDLEEPTCWLGFQGSDKPTGTGSWQVFPSETCQGA